MKEGFNDKQISPHVKVSMNDERLILAGLSSDVVSEYLKEMHDLYAEASEAKKLDYVVDFKVKLGAVYKYFEHFISVACDCYVSSGSDGGDKKSKRNSTTIAGYGIYICIIYIYI